MKKSLIALAVLAASGAAMAQSSVTLYGVADVALGKVNTVPNGTNTMGTVPNTKFQALANGDLTNGNSRFGLKGTEDLGGGLKANFQFEASINIANGASQGSGSSTTSTGYNGVFFGREAWVGLSGDFGELRAGRDLTTSFNSAVSWELTGAANYSAVAHQFGWNGVGPRDSAMVKYVSPNFSGFSFGADTVLPGNYNCGTSTTNPTTGVVTYTPGTGNGVTCKGKYDLAATYANGPVVASLAYNKQDNLDPKQIKKGVVLGGKFDFGPVIVAGSIQNYKDGNSLVLGRGFSLGATVPLGAFSLTADVARDTYFKDTDFVLEAKYSLSKRTFVYAAYLHDGAPTNNATRQRVATSTAVTANSGDQATPTSGSVNGYSLGIRHNF